MIGGCESEDDYNAVRILEKDGVKIAFLSYTYGTNGITLGSGYNVVIPYLDEATVKSQIETCAHAGRFRFRFRSLGNRGSFHPERRAEEIRPDNG